MKRSIFILLSVAISLSVMAASPRLSRAQLKNVTIIKDDLGNTQTAASARSFVSPLSLGQESQFDMNGNRLDRPSVKNRSFVPLLGNRIASAELYNFNWDAESGTATVHNSSCASIGRLCEIPFFMYPHKPGYYLTSLFGDFRIPLDIDTITGAVTIKAGEELHTFSNFGDVEPVKMNAPGALTEAPTRFWTLYAMPLSWLTGDDDYDDIHGQVQEDGTITFSDDFAFLVRSQCQGEITWGLSLIYTNLTLLVPNGRHEFRYKHYEDDDFTIQGTEGNGGLVPRNPGQTKPITQRPFVPVNGAGPRHEDTPGIKSEVVYSDESAPVYMCMADESTLTVYNLFGLGYHCSIKTSQQNGSIDLRRQIIYYNGPDSLSRISYYYNRPSTGTWAQDTITWNGTVMCDASGFSLGRSFLDNRLFYSDGFTLFGILEPNFEPLSLTDTTVVISATTASLDGEAQLFRYDEAAQSYYQVENPLTVPRLSEPYWVLLAACTYDTIRCQYSTMVYTEYEVPALSMRGDVNNDGSVNITDVILLITAILNSDGTAIDLYAADVDGDEWINISDVIKLINYVSNNVWYDDE